MTKTYSEKLRDPRWQKKRLEILNRDGFRCIVCDSEDKELHVHHLRYSKGASPWDYENPDLVTLCDPCHSSVEKLKSAISYDLGRLDRLAAYATLASLLRGPDSSKYLDGILAVLRRSPEMMKPVMDMLEVYIQRKNELESAGLTPDTGLTFRSLRDLISNL
jgi:hypothetical protein